MISAIVLIGGNHDKKLLANCFDSLSWCDEILKVETKKINGSFADWRNEGLKRAKEKWVLYIDTDEEISLAMRDEILSTVNGSQSTVHAYAIPRKNYIFGQEFKYGGQWPDYQKRLFLKSKLIKWIGELHEEPEFVGELGTLKNSIIHHKDITISEMLEKTNKWSEIESKLMFDANHPRMNIFRFISAGWREFLLRFAKQLCFLDGTKGVIYGIYQVYSRLISYSKLWEKQQSITLT